METIIQAGVTLAATEGIKELVKTCISSYIKPKIEKFNNKAEFENSFNFLNEDIDKYMERSYSNALIMNTIVFKNQQKTINDLYIPLTLVKTDLLNENNKQEICINKYRGELIGEYKKILIIDSAGMGKSTIIKYLYLMTIKENKGIPILIELRKLKENMTIIQYIVNEMNGIKKSFTEEQKYWQNNNLKGNELFDYIFNGKNHTYRSGRITKKSIGHACNQKNNIIMLSKLLYEKRNIIVKINEFGKNLNMDIDTIIKPGIYELNDDKDNELNNKGRF